MRLLTLLLTAVILTSCASGGSIRDVPKIDATKITVPAMSALPQRDLSLAVVDSRSELYRDQSIAVQAEIQRATQQALGDAGIQVNAISNNALTLTIQDYQTQKYQEGCVKITGSLLIPKQARLGSEAVSCRESKVPISGRQVSTNITAAYEEALTLVFKNLDEALGKLQTMKK